MAKLGLTDVLFIADALHRQKDEFAQAAATSNTLLVCVKGGPAHPACRPGRTYATG